MASIAGLWWTPILVANHEKAMFVASRAGVRKRILRDSCHSRRKKGANPFSSSSSSPISLVLPSVGLDCGPEMRLVGLTGGIASGKSTVSDLFISEGFPVVDADVVARDVVKKGTGGWKKVVKEFGNDILLENGEIDRARLGHIVFSDPAKRQLLNRLLAPYICSGIFWVVFKLWIKGSKVIILDIPLLFETKMDQQTSPVIVVWVDPETQIKRLMARDGIPEEQAKNKINAQMALDQKKTKANIVIDNSGTVEETRLQFQKVLSQISRPLTWKEYALSRDGIFLLLTSAVVGVLAVRKNLP